MHKADKASPESKTNQVKRTAIFRFGFPWWFNLDSDEKNTPITVNGMILTPLIDITPGTLNGVAVSGFLMHETVNGVVISPLFSITKETNGLALSCCNWSSDKAIVQVGLINLCEFMWASGKVIWQTGVVNEAGSSRFQLGLFNNSWVDAWLQLGLVNTVIGPDKYSDPNWGKRPSEQIGLYNDIRNGIQLGLSNRNENGWLWKYSPLINFSTTQE